MKKLFGVKLLSVAMLFIAAALVLTSCKISVILPGDTPVGGSVADGDGTKAPDIKDTSKQPDNIEIKYSDNGKRTAYTNEKEDAFVNTWLDISYFADYSDKNVVKGDDGVYRFTFAEFDNMTLKLVELTPEQALKIHRIASIPALVTSYAGRYK